MLKTGDVARIIGVTRATLNNWERKGILLPDEITPTGRRLYTEEHIQRVKEGLKYERSRH